MNHISDHILEVYALNRHALSVEIQVEVYQHIGSCSECREVLSYLCSIWKKDLHLMFEPIEVSDSEITLTVDSQQETHSDTATPDNSVGYYVTSSLQKKLRVSRSFSAREWFISVLTDSEHNDSIVLSRLSLVNDWITLPGSQRTPVAGFSGVSPEDLLKSTASYKISQDVVLPSDEFMIHTKQQTILVDTHRSELNSAVLETPHKPLSHFSATTGTFEIPVKLWTKHSKMHLFTHRLDT